MTFTEIPLTLTVHVGKSLAVGSFTSHCKPRRDCSTIFERFHPTVVLPGSRSPESMVRLKTSSFYGAQDPNSQNLRWELSDIAVIPPWGKVTCTTQQQTFPLNSMSQRHIPAGSVLLCWTRGVLTHAWCSSPHKYLHICSDGLCATGALRPAASDLPWACRNTLAQAIIQGRN